MIGARVSSDQWDRFVSEYWGKQPVCIPNVFSTPFLSEEEFLEALKGLGAAVRSLPVGAMPGSDMRDLCYFAGDTPTVPVEGVHPFPLPDETRLDDYYQRVKSQLAGQDFLLTGFDLQTYSPVIWERILAFLRPLIERVGHPPNLAKCDSFLGKYTSTPVGVHYDSADVLTFILRGQKRFRLWPWEFREEQAPDLESSTVARYSKYLDRAITIDACERDLVYWPNTFWHIAENDQFSATMTVMLEQYDYRLPRDPCVPRWTIERVADRASRLDRVSTSDLTSGFPPALADALNRFVAAQQGDEFVDYLWKCWLERSSKLSFNENPPEARTSNSVAGSTFIVNEAVALEWTRLSTGEILCAGNGQSFTLEGSQDLVNLLDRIVLPRSWTVSELVHEFATGTLTESQIMRCVERCIRLRAVNALEAP